MRKRKSLAPLVSDHASGCAGAWLCRKPRSRLALLIVNGQTGQVTVVQMNGRSYVDLETLARIANGSLGFSGNQITLTLPVAASTPAASAASASAPPPPTAPANPGFSRGLSESGHRSNVPGQGMAQRTR